MEFKITNHRQTFGSGIRRVCGDACAVMEDMLVAERNWIDLERAPGAVWSVFGSEGTAVTD